MTIGVVLRASSVETVPEAASAMSAASKAPIFSSGPSTTRMSWRHSAASLRTLALMFWTVGRTILMLPAAADVCSMASRNTDQRNRISLLRDPGRRSRTFWSRGIPWRALKASPCPGLGARSITGWPTKEAPMPTFWKMGTSNGSRQSTWSKDFAMVSARLGREAHTCGAT